MSRTSRRTATTGLAWEAVAPVVRWPLHSPTRLAAFLVAVVAIVVLIAAARTAAVADPAPSTSTSTSSTSPRIATATPPPPPAPAVGTSPQAAGVASSPAQVAVRFVTAWARPDLPVEVWQVDVIVLATPQFGAQLRTVDPRNVPARSVTGAATTTSAAEVTATVQVPTDAGPVVVEVAVMGTAWQVSGVTPAGPPGSTDGARSSLAATYTPLPGGA